LLGSALDANGNTLSDPSGKTYSWDFENRLTQAVTSSGTTTFKYDPWGKRIYKSSPNFTGIFVYDGLNLIETVNLSGAKISSYTQTQNIDEPVAELRGSTSDYYEADGLGSITSLSSSTGVLANTYTYDSFGNVTNLTGTLSNPFRYTARNFDGETGLYYYRARYYDPTVGRFISEDPIGFKGGIDFYAYVKNRPVSFVDPSGLKGCCKSHECPGRACYIDNCASAWGPGGTAILGFDCSGDKDCCIDAFTAFQKKCDAYNWPGYPKKYKANYDPGQSTISGQCCQLYQ
jgi:RHS repeat-associated protein